MNIYTLFPPSESCTCDICRNYCKRSGWWTVDEFEKILKTPFYKRVMLEVSPELTFGVLSPAFKGCENNFALQEYSKNGCTFLKNNLCELYETGNQPLECKFCHHDRIGKGIECHQALENQWNTVKGQKIIRHWIKMVDFPYGDYYYKIIKRR
jgi:hypothetical protein